MKVRSDNEIELLTKVSSLFSKIVGSMAKQSEHFNEIKKLINYIYQQDSWSILRLDETSHQLFFTVVKGDSAHVLKQIPIKLGEGVCGEVALTGKPQVVTFFEDKPPFTQSIDKVTGFVTQSIVAVPIIARNKVIGVLELINVEQPEVFKKSKHMNLLQIIANLIGLIFALSSSHQEILDFSERDILTGLYNRFWIKKFISSLSPNDEDDCLISMIDLNNFKKVNDTYGHLTGDSILKETANLLIKGFRKNDLIIRYGGDEFIVIIDLQNNNQFTDVKASTQKKLNKISKALPYSCSLSYGISYGKKRDFYSLLDKADKFMYSNKRSDKNLMK